MKPGWFQEKLWTLIHDVLAHPICGLCWILGLQRLGNWLHVITVHPLNYDDEHDINVQQFRDPTTWKKLRTMLHTATEPNPINRHEACFVVGELNIVSLIPDLMQVVTEDPSIVARHEAIEALGSMWGSDVLVPTISSFLAGIKANKNNDPLLEHGDIIDTLEIALKHLARATKTASS